MKRTLLAVAAITSLTSAAAAASPPFTPHAVVQRLAAELRARYVFPDRANSTAAALLGADRRGAFATATTAEALAKSLDTFLSAQLHDKHLHVLYDGSGPQQGPPPGGTVQDRFRDFDAMIARVENRGVRMAAQLPGNVGYLRISGFPDATLMANGVASAMSLLHDTDAMIVDLRDNHGGDPVGVTLLESYFFPPWKQTHFNDVIERTSEGFMTRQYWSQPVPAALYYPHNVYVLTSAQTISAGEGFAYEMQAEKRATVVGAVTAGGANPEREVDLGQGFTAQIPFGRADNPITHTNWEGTGVQPDVRVPEAQALQTSYIAALKHLLDGRPQDRARLQRLIDAATHNPDGILN